MTIDNQKRAALSQKLRFLAQADDPFSRRFFEKAVLTTLKKGQYVCHEGSSCSHLAILLDGTARVYKLGESGKEITLYRVGPGESCVLTASCILSEVPFPAIAVCETAVEAVVIPAGDVQKWLSESVTWRNYIFGLVATRLTNIINVVEDVAFRRMDKRIAEHLYKRTDRTSHLLLATHQEIASELGTSREVVSRILKDFELEAIIKVTRGAIELLDPEKLERRRCEL
jgi:CRP/FNR family transcriptional regulator